MHVLGKVLLGFVVVGALAAIFLTTMLLDARGHWQQRVDAARAAFENAEEQLAAQRVIANSLQLEVDRLQVGWGQTVLAPNSQTLNAQQGVVSIGAGSQRGVGTRRDANNPQATTINQVYIFRPDENEAQASAPESTPPSQFLGAFTLQNVEPGSAEAVLIRPPYSDEQFPGGTWRVREIIPHGYATQMQELYTRQIAAEARLQRMKYDIARLNEQRDASMQLLQERMKELNGDPDLMEASDLQRAGYVQAMRDRMTERDQLLQRLHELRLERRLKLEALQALNEQIQQRANRYAQQALDAAPNDAATAADVTPAAAN